MTDKSELLIRDHDQLDRESCLLLLQRVASSAPLRRANRLQELLQFLGQSALRDGREQLHEQEIGIKVFGRPENYDTSIDNIVRTNVSDLRKRIETYFVNEGAQEPVVIEIPRGRYLPVFRPRIAEAAPDTSSGAEQTEADVLHEVAIPDTKPAVQSKSRTLRSIAVIFLIVILAVACAFLWLQLRAFEHALHPWKDSPSVAAFWSDFLGASGRTDVVLPDTSFGLIESLSGKRFSFNQYLNRSYAEQIETAPMSADTRTAINTVASQNIGTQSTFKLAERILSLDPLGEKMHPYSARDYMPELVKHDNVILLGARIANPWDELFESRMNFVAETENSVTTIVNRSPSTGEQKLYTRTDNSGYCTVAMLPNPSGSGRVLLLEGTSSEATEAAGDFLLSEEQMSRFRHRINADHFPYFEVLLKISSVRGTPLTATIEAYRIYSGN
jgi:hypothetical protein